jgi:hypothetical protein
MESRLDFSALAIIGLVLVVVILVALNITSGPKPGFSELFFSGEPPKTAKLNESQSFSFGVHNLENKQMTYEIAIYLNDTLIGSKNISLSKNQEMILTGNFTITGLAKESSLPVRVKLLNRDQEIHFWVDVE